jgi:superfamily II DNA or RNA helicase
MVVITVGNSYSRITGLTIPQLNAARKELSYLPDPKAAYYRGGWAHRKYLLDLKGNFPSGLKRRLCHYLQREEIKYKVTFCNRRPKSSPAKFSIDYKGIIPYEAQEIAVRKCYVYGNGGIVMPTGTGKSLVITMLIDRMRVKTLVVVPTLEIKKQLQATIDHYFGKNDYIRIENIDSSALPKLKDYDMLILDECHHAVAKTYHKLNKTAWRDIYHRYFFSATFFRNQPHETMLFEAICGQKLYELTYTQAVKSDIIVPIEAYYVNVPKTATEAYTYREVYDTLVVDNAPRNGIIAGLLEALKGKSTLCLVKEIEHGRILSEMTGVPFVSGQDEESRVYIRQFNSGGIKQIIATTGVMGEGVDSKPCEYVIIAGIGKAKSSFMQQVGRAVRRYEGKESAKVIIFNDKSHKFTRSHFKTETKILLDSYGVKPVLLY